MSCWFHVAQHPPGPSTLLKVAGYFSVFTCTRACTHLYLYVLTCYRFFTHLSMLFMLLIIVNMKFFLTAWSHFFVDMPSSKIIGSWGISVLVFISWFSVVLSVECRVLLMVMAALPLTHSSSPGVLFSVIWGAPISCPTVAVLWSLNIHFCLLGSKYPHRHHVLPPWAFDFHLPGDQW